MSPEPDDLTDWDERFRAWQDARSEAAERAAARAPSKLPYSSPVLRHIGSVRKLTLAGTGTRPDFVNGRHQH